VKFKLKLWLKNETMIHHYPQELNLQVHGIDQGGEQGGGAQEDAPQVENDDDGPIL
jgi:hypothetical protein